MSNAIDVAARFGDIPFKDFTVGLVTEIFDALVESHILQVEEYATLLSSTSQDLTTYINNTQDNVTFSEISDFLLDYDIPVENQDAVVKALEMLKEPGNDGKPVDLNPASDPASDTGTWYSGVINALAPAVTGLVDKINDPSELQGLNAVNTYNEKVLEGANRLTDNLPTYGQIRSAVASLMTSNKYGILQSVIKQGMMRLVVTEGEIETRITFSTYDNSTRGSSSSSNVKDKVRTKMKRRLGGGIPIFGYGKRKRKRTSKTVTVNSAQSYQRDSSGTSVNIFGRCLIRFKSDYAPLNG